MPARASRPTSSSTPSSASPRGRGADEKGAGLGLAIVDAVARAHGGEAPLGTFPARRRVTISIPVAFEHMTTIDPRVDIGHVHLKVADIERALGFYVDVLGFELQQRMGDQAAFISAGDYHHHIGLNTWESRGGSPPPPGSTGLYHTAIRYPDREQLADALRRLVEAGIPLTGASDHGVSEALYLNDPDGNGVELYRDRPREEWPLDPDGGVAMMSIPLDVEALLRPRRRNVPRGYMEGPAADEAERRLDELERGAPEETAEERLAVFGSTADDPEKHFIGWRDDVDPDELFASGEAWGLSVVRRPVDRLGRAQLRCADVQERDRACALRERVRDRLAALERDRGLDRPLDLGEQQRPRRHRALLQLREQLDGGDVFLPQRPDRDRLGLERGRAVVLGLDPVVVVLEALAGET